MNPFDKATLTDISYRPHAEYWKKLLMSCENKFHFGHGRKVHAVENSRGFKLLVIEGELYNSITRLTKQNDMGIFVCLLSVSAALLKRYAGQQDIIIDSPLYCINAGSKTYVERVPLVIKVEDEYTLKDYFNSVRDIVRDAYKYQNFPLHMINGSENAFSTNVLIRYNALHLTTNRNTFYDLVILLEREESDKIKISLEYNRQVFDDYFLDNFLTDFAHVLTYLEALQTPLKHVEILSGRTQHLLNAPHDSTSAFLYPQATIHQAFEKQASKTPDAVAIVCEGHCLTYQALNERSNQLAHYLENHFPASAESIVGLLCTNSEWLIISILAILKRGMAYVPIDTSYPVKRIVNILDDACCSLVITNQARFSTISASSHRCKTLWVDDLASIETYPKVNPDKPVSPTAMAYIIYTSGSTGAPKGVIIEHRSIVNLVEGLKKGLGMEGGWKYILTSSISFDASVKQIFVPLTLGAQLHIRENLKNVSGLASYVQQHTINTLHLSPDVWSLVLNEEKNKNVFSSLLLVSSGGAALPKKLATQMRNQIRQAKLFNTYGPTEACVNALVEPLGDVIPESVPIGKPLQNYRVCVLDEHLRLQPVGVVGEIGISGAGIGRGYLNLPAATRQKFVNNPFEADAPLYLTGDLGRMLPDGSIAFVGRKDCQVKVRGFRIELEEVENTILKHGSVADVKVLVRQKTDVEKYLVAFIISKGKLSIDDLKEYLAACLPDYMLPSRYIFQDRFPLQINGKLDQAELLRIEAAASTGHAAYVAPSSAAEKKLIEIWQQVLGREGIGVKDKFFDLGGHSMKAIQLTSRVLKEFHVQLDLKTVLSNLSLEEQAQLIARSAGKKYELMRHVEEQEHYRLSYPQNRLWFMHYLQERKTAYNMVGGHLLEGELDVNAFVRAFESVVSRHEGLRTTFALIDNEPRQKIHPFSDALTVELIDVSRADRVDEACQRIVQREVDKSYDLAVLPLWNAKLIRLGTQKHLFLINLHHILSDGWSNQIMVNELLTLYQVYREDQHYALPALSHQYKDYSFWMSQHTFSSHYWEKVFADEVPRLILPADLSRSKTFANEGEKIETILDPELQRKLNAVAAGYETSLSTVFFSLYNILLSKWCLTNDFVVGSLVSGRSRYELEGMIGVFINFLPVRSYIDESLAYGAYLQRFGEELNQAYDLQDFPFELLINKYQKHAESGANPLYNTLFNYYFTENLSNSLAHTFKQTGLKISDYNVDQFTSYIDLKLDVYNSGNQVKVSFEYDTGLFERSSIKKLLEKYVTLLELAAQNPALEIKNICLFDKDEMDAIKDKLEAEQRCPQVLNINLLATFVIDPVVDYVKYWLDESGLDFTIHVGAYNQLFQQLIGKARETPAENNVNVLYIRFEDYLRDLDELPPNSKIARVESIYADLKRVVADLSCSDQKYIVGTFPVASNATGSKVLSDLIVRLNNDWKTFLSGQKHVHVMDFVQAGQFYEVKEIFDPTTDRIGHMPFTPEFYAAIGTYTARVVVGLRSPGYKVIAVDCDNTLWKGICGEESLDAIEVGEGHKSLQKFLLNKYQEGFLLVICSKNNEEEVWNVFSHHPGMVLKREHILAAKINWQSKADNLRDLARELNLATDSFIFVDDSPVECEEMMQRRPEVLTLLLPQDPDHYYSFLNHIWAFDKYNVTDEDKSRNQSYRQDQERKKDEKSYSSVDDFISSLEIKIEIIPLREDQVERASQLTFRTNQFNLNGITITEQEFYKLLKMTDVCCWIVRVSDRFGEYGLTGLAVFKISGDLLELNTFLLSCRVLGRGIEYALLAELEKYCKSMAVERIAVHYRNTNKNNVLKRFLDELRQHSSAWATDTQLRVGSLSVAGQNNILVGGVLD